jgi:PST family polysaccharide transporter
MATAAIGSLTQAAVRSILAQQLGLEAAGLFQASFAISSLNLGIVLGAMVPEYYPRLSAVAKDSVAVERLLNHQIHIGLLLAAPALIAISAGAPILLKLLYSEAFTGASLLLRLQVAADCLRILGWALGFVLLARKASVAYLFPELIFGAVFIPVTWTAVPHYGLAATGVAYVAAYATSLTATATYIAKLHRISVSRSNALKAGTLFAVLLSVAAVSLISEWAALAIGALAFAGASYPAWLEIQRIRLAKEGVAPDSSGPAGGGPKVDV